MGLVVWAVTQKVFCSGYLLALFWFQFGVLASSTLLIADLNAALFLLLTCLLIAFLLA